MAALMSPLIIFAIATSCLHGLSLPGRSNRALKCFLPGNGSSSGLEPALAVVRGFMLGKRS